MKDVDARVFAGLFRDAYQKCFSHDLSAPLTESESHHFSNEILEKTGLVIGWKSLKNYSHFVLSTPGHTPQNPSISTLDTLARYVADAPPPTKCAGSRMSVISRTGFNTRRRSSPRTTRKDRTSRCPPANHAGHESGQDMQRPGWRFSCSFPLPCRSAETPGKPRSPTSSMPLRRMPWPKKDGSCSREQRIIGTGAVKSPVT